MMGALGEGAEGGKEACWVPATPFLYILQCAEERETATDWKSKPNPAPMKQEVQTVVTSPF